MKGGIKEVKKCCYSHFTTYFRDIRKENQQRNIKKKTFQDYKIGKIKK